MANRLCSILTMYWPLLKYYLPIVLTGVAPDIAEQALNRGITSSGGDKVIDTLAGFGLAFMVVKFLGVTGVLADVRHVGLVMVHTRKDRIKAFIFCCITSGILTTIQVVFGATVIGTYFVKDLHNVTPVVNQIAKDSMLYLAGLPFIESVAKLHEGMLLKEKHSILVAAGSLTDVGSQTIVTILLLLTSLKESSTILIPVIAVYTGMLARFVICVVCYYIKVHPHLKDISNQSSDVVMNAVSLRSILCFWWPIALVTLVQKVSRPVINIFVARSEPDEKMAAQALAVLAVTYPVAHTFYSGLNGIRTIVPPFIKATDSYTRYTLCQLGVFAALMGLASLTLMLLVFFIPGGTMGITTVVIGVTEDIGHLCIVPLYIFSFFPIPVAVRGFFTSWLISKKATKFMAPSAVVRITFVVASLFAWPHIGVRGAEMGVAALLGGFVVEMISILIGSFVVYKKKTFDIPQDGEQVELPDAYDPRQSMLDITEHGKPEWTQSNGGVPDGESTIL